MAYGARLLMARVRAWEAHFAYDEDAAQAADAILDRLDREGAPFGHEVLDRELAITRAEVAFLREDFAFAKARYATLLAETEALTPELVARARAGMAAAISREVAGRPGDGGHAETAVLEALTTIRELRAGVFLAYVEAPAHDPSRAPYNRHLVRTLLAEAVVTSAADPATGLELAQRAKAIAQEDGLQIPLTEAHLLVGRLSRVRGNYAIALRLLYGGLDIADQIGYARVALDFHAEIACAYQSVGNDAEADKHFRHVAEAAERFGRDDALYAAAHDLGCSAHRTGRLEDAVAHFATALAAARRRGNAAEHGTVLAEMGDLQVAAGNHEVAQHYLDASRRQFAEADAALTAKAELLGARMALHDGEYAGALALAQRAERLGRETHRPRVAIAALECQSACHEALDAPAEALRTARAASARLGDLVTRYGEKRLGDLDMRAALREREREIEKLTRENDLKGTLIAKNEEIARANADLLQANEELRQFAFAASHDLKEPLRQVGSYVSLLKRKYAADLDEDGRTYFGFVSEGVARLNRLFDSLMHYTAVARMDNEVQEVKLDRLLDAVRKELSDSLRANGAELRYGDLPTVETGPKLLRHVFSALVDNAVRFRREDVAPVIDISADERDGMLLLCVRDNGIGIDQQYADRVFQLFQMLEAKSGNPGTGVGLAIAQKTVQRLGGRIWFEDNADGSPGVTFCFTLPMGVERRMVTQEDEGVLEAA